MKQGHPSALREGAFTLVELLVVVAIIGVLAGLLLPALASAREKARRVSCVSNLNQLSKAVEIYCGRFGQYLPVSPNMGRQYVGRYAGIYTGNPYGHAAYFSQSGGTTGDRMTTVQFSATEREMGGTNAQRYFGIETHGCIAFGTKFQAPGDGDRWSPGQVNAAPIGLGMLVTSECVSDLKSLYCPSGSHLDYGLTSGPVGLGRFVGFKEINSESVPYGRMSTNIADLKLLGGSDGRALVAGDWRGIVSDSEFPADWTRKMMGCSYAYRAQPTSIETRDQTLPVDGRPYWSNGYDQSAQNCPGVCDFRTLAGSVSSVWRTQKLLGNRALVIDRFGKRQRDVDHGETQHAGDGWFIHRSGYNVLYGDGHAQWLGDTEERFVWVDEFTYTGRDAAAWSAKGSNVSTVTPARVEWGGVSHGVIWWSRFDKAADIDVNVPTYHDGF